MLDNRSTVIGKLCEYWNANQQRIPLRSGIGQALISSFESSRSLQLPEDFATYLRRINGFIGNDDPHDWSTVCNEGFYFYPLQELKLTTDSSSCYAFCHNEITLQEYAIELGQSSRNGEVGIIGNSGLIHVADSFSEFIELYISKSDRLYSGGALAPYA